MKKVKKLVMLALCVITIHATVSPLVVHASDVSVNTPPNLTATLTNDSGDSFAIEGYLNMNETRAYSNSDVSTVAYSFVLDNSVIKAAGGSEYATGTDGDSFTVTVYGDYTRPEYNLIPGILLTNIRWNYTITNPNIYLHSVEAFGCCEGSMLYSSITNQYEQRRTWMIYNNVSPFNIATGFTDPVKRADTELTDVYIECKYKLRIGTDTNNMWTLRVPIDIY